MLDEELEGTKDGVLPQGKCLNSLTTRGINECA